MPLDIQNKQFPKSMRGYKEEDVDQFLDLLTLDYEKVIEETHVLKEKLIEMKKELQAYKEQEESIKETLETAKQMMLDISESAEKRAELILKNAELDAERMIKEAKATTAKIFEEHEDAKNRIHIFTTRYKNLLESELERFNTIGSELFDEHTL